MKKFIKLGLILVVLISFTNVNAQNKLKIGHVNSSQILDLMPEKDSAKKTLEEYAKSLDKELQDMQAEIEKKYQAYQTQQNSMNEIVKQSKVQEMQEMQARMQSFQQTAQQEIATKEQNLITPILEKLQNAIKEVAKENSFTYIFDVSTGGNVLFYENGEDITNLVKKKLNLK